VEAESNVVGDPVSVSIAEHGLEQGDGVGESGCAIVWSEAVEDSVAKRVQP